MLTCQACCWKWDVSKQGYHNQRLHSWIDKERKLPTLLNLESMVIRLKIEFEWECKELWVEIVMTPLFYYKALVTKIIKILRSCAAKSDGWDGNHRLAKGTWSLSYLSIPSLKTSLVRVLFCFPIEQKAFMFFSQSFLEWISYFTLSVYLQSLWAQFK